MATDLNAAVPVDRLRVALGPVAERVATLVYQSDAMVVVGISGAQGSGKSTQAKILQAMLERDFRFRTALLSLDDLYLDRAARAHLGQTVHPLLQVRGAPGTHDIGLGLDVLERLRGATQDTEFRLPAFDKANDDRVPSDRWPVWQGPCDVAILEGWCLGARPQPAQQLVEPVNTLERQCDPDGRWRHYVNRALSREYQVLFSKIDMLVMLRVPSMTQVVLWRQHQERRLAAETTTGHAHVMSDAQVAQFVMHFERLTRFMLEEMPSRADVVIDIDEDHMPVEL